MSIKVERWSRDETPNPRALREAMEEEGYSVFEWSDEPGTVYKAHRHAEDQSHWIVSGTLELHVLGESYTLRPGDRDFLPANVVHAAFVPGRQTVHYLIGAKK